MENVRTRLGVRSVTWKVEKRVLERICHVFMMRNEKLTKAIVLGWWEELERWEKRPEKKRKRILHWKMILREAGIDWTDVERLTGDTEGWRKIVREKEYHAERWDRQRGHRFEWGEGGERMQFRGAW